MYRQMLRKIKRYFEHRSVVLMYHRIADLPMDPWQLAVSPENFEQQLKVLRNKFNIISVDDLIGQLHKKSIYSDSVCITFDDGYLDNYVAAKPLLEKYQCPATFFIATQFIGKQQQFWWDELQNIILDTPILPPSFLLFINGRLLEYKLENDAVLTKEKWMQQRSWTCSEPPPSRRCELYLSIWEQLKPLPFDELQAALKMIRSWAGHKDSSFNGDIPLSNHQINEIKNHHLFDIGIHTVTHSSLSSHPREFQFREIEESKQCLKRNFRHYKNIITYPYGDFNETTLDVVKCQNLSAGFTTRGAIVTNRSNPYKLGRFQVMNWDGAEFENHLTRWMRNK